MTILIDTHIFLWALIDPERLGQERRNVLQTRANEVFLSSISIVELIIKASLGKLDLGFNPLEMAEKSGFGLLEYSAQDALGLQDLPLYHKDPFDRMIIAQSLNRGFPIMTVDGQFAHYPCKLI